MAKYNPSAMIGTLRGSIGGTKFSLNSAGAYASNKQSGVNPKSQSQGFQRGGFGTTSRAWRGITEAQRTAWDAAASGYPHYDKFGNLTVLTGQQAFIMINRNQSIVSAAQLDNPPVWGAYIAPSIVNLVMTVAGTHITLTMSAGVPAGSDMLVYATPGLSSGRMMSTSQYKLITGLGGGSAAVQELFTVWQTKYGMTAVAGRKVFIKIIYIVNTTGQRALAGQISGIFV